MNHECLIGHQGFPIKIENKVVKSYFKVAKPKKQLNMQPCPKDNRSFFEKLQNEKGLDLRDNRGKRHDLAVALIGVMLALLSN
jgi:hypothetical protein